MVLPLQYSISPVGAAAAQGFYLQVPCNVWNLWRGKGGNNQNLVPS